MPFFFATQKDNFLNVFFKIIFKIFKDSKQYYYYGLILQQNT